MKSGGYRRSSERDADRVRLIPEAVLKNRYQQFGIDGEVLPVFGLPRVGIFGVKAHAGEPFISDIGDLLPIALWGRTFLHFRPRVVKAHEPMNVRTFRTELAVERLDEAIVCRFSRAGEVEGDALLVGPQIRGHD